jgi:hypothetical protein
VSGHSQWGIPLNDDEELPTGWEKHKSSSGEIYYGNQKEKITQWEKPIFDPTQIPFLAEWETKVSSRCKQIYYINKHTHKSQWNYPDEKLQQSNCVELVGDSILDNSYWNNVDIDNTAEILRQSGIKVVDRGTEEVNTEQMLISLKNNIGINVRDIYIKSRMKKGIPYELKNSLVMPNPSDSDIWNVTPTNKRFIVLSLGGNDVALSKNYSILNIVNNIREVIKLLLEKTKISSKNFAYLIPYTPGPILNKIITESLKVTEEKMNGTQFYKNMVSLIIKMCKELNIKCISLSDFTDEDKIGHLIPEPTKKGAKKIAERIITWIKTREQILADKPEHVPKFSIQTLVNKLISGGKDLSSKDLNSINKIIEKNLDFKNSSLLNQDYTNPVHRGIVIVLLLLCKNNPSSPFFPLGNRPEKNLVLDTIKKLEHNFTKTFIATKYIFVGFYTEKHTKIPLVALKEKLIFKSHEKMSAAEIYEINNAIENIEIENVNPDYTNPVHRGMIIALLSLLENNPCEHFYPLQYRDEHSLVKDITKLFEKDLIDSFALTKKRLY